MEKYIGKCLDSLLIPEFDQVEVLVVNDGSKDCSSEIAHSYADRYPGSIRVIDKPNGNYGSCINAALPQCTGRYVKVLDADDTFDTAAFSQFVRKLKDCNEDAIITNYITVNEFDKESAKSDFNSWNINFDEIIPMDSAWQVIRKQFILMHMLTYKWSIFSKFNYHQTEGISYTDREWASIPICCCNDFRFLNLQVYKYLLGREGQTMSPAQMSAKFSHLLQVVDTLCKYYSNCDFKLEVVKDHILFNVIRHHCDVYKIGVKTNLENIISLIRNYDKALKDLHPEVYNGIGKYRIYPFLSYYFFQRLRDKNYPLKLNIPFLIKVTASMHFRMEKLFHKNQ